MSGFAIDLTVKYKGVDTHYVLASRLREADEEIRATREMMRSVEVALGLCKEEVRDARAERDRVLSDAQNDVRIRDLEARLREAEQQLRERDYDLGKTEAEVERLRTDFAAMKKCHDHDALELGRLRAGIRSFLDGTRAPGTLHWLLEEPEGSSDE